MRQLIDTRMNLLREQKKGWHMTLKTHLILRNPVVRFFCLAVFLLQAASAYSTTLTVSTNGTLDSLYAAKEAVYELRQEGTNDDIIVEFESGTYYFTNTVIFNTDDSAPTNAQTIYRAASGADVVFSGGHVVTNWEIVTTPYPEGLPAAAQGNVYQANVSALVANSNCFYALIKGDTMLSRASSAQDSSFNSGYFHLFYNKASTVPRDWSNVGDIEVRGRPGGTPYKFVFLPLDSVDRTLKKMNFARSSSGPFNNAFTLENAIDFLDSQGEWCVNTETGMLYYWPETGTDPNSSEIVVPLLDEVIRIEGVEDTNTALDEGEEPTDVPVRGLVFEGFTFAHADRYAYKADNIGLQEDWDLYDNANGLLRFRVAADCEVRDCTFINSASGGVRLDLYCQNITVKNSIFNNLGSTGILLSGYAPGRKNVSKNNTITNNKITNIGRLWIESAGIFVTQSEGNTISHNYVANPGASCIVLSGHRGRSFERAVGGETTDGRGMWQAIRTNEITETDFGATPGNPAIYEKYLHGRNNVFEYNELTDSSSGGNIIYMSATGIGNTFRYNALYEPGGGGPHIRLDMVSYDVTISKNILFGPRPSLTLKGLSYITNNLFINTQHEDIFRKTISGNTCKRNIYYYMADIDVNQFHSTKQTGTHNLYHHVDISLATGGLLNMSSDQNCDVGDPLFVDIENADFSFKTNSPASALGIEPIPRTEIAKIGLLNDSFLTGRFLPNVNTFLYDTETPDADGDGMLDAWEMQIANDSSSDSIANASDVLPDADFDGDGVSNIDEYNAGTDPVMAPGDDTDGDGLLDTWEQLIIDADPNDNITSIDGVHPASNHDSDGNDNLDEYRKGTNPIDSEPDGLYDRWEGKIIEFDSNDEFKKVTHVHPEDDFDGDGVCNFFEYLYGSDPTVADSQGFRVMTDLTPSGNRFLLKWQVGDVFDFGTKYGIEVSTNLQNWSSLPSNYYELVETATNGMNAVQLTITNDVGPAVFFRMTN